MKLGVVNKSTTVNRFVLHTLLRNITHLAVIVQKTNIKLDILKVGGGGGEWKRAENPPPFEKILDPPLSLSIVHVSSSYILWIARNNQNPRISTVFFLMNQICNYKCMFTFLFMRVFHACLQSFSSLWIWQKTCLSKKMFQQKSFCRYE